MYRPIKGKRFYYLIAIVLGCISSFVFASIPNKAFAYTEITDCVNGVPVNPQPSIHQKATINVKVTAPTGMNSQLELSLKDSSGKVVGKAKTCGNLTSKQLHTVLLKTSFFDIDQGKYKICLNTDCYNTEVKKSGSAYLNPTVSISLDSSQVPDQFMSITIEVRMKVETPTVGTTYGPVPTVLTTAEGDMSKEITYTGSERFAAKTKLSEINLSATYSPARDGVMYRGCIPDSDGSLWKCSEYGTKKANQNLKLYIDLDESESKKFISNVEDSPTCGDIITTGIGWIICPVLGTITATNSVMWSATDNLLTVNPLTQTEHTVYDGWKVIRDLANVVFVIVFLVIVFSQLTGTGVTNYGVKKILPRIVIAAILVNISFILMQVLVDVFNIVGSSLYDVIYKATPAVSVGWGDILGSFLTSSSLAIGVGAAAIIIADGPMALLFMLLPSAIIGFLSLLAAVFTLVFRQAVIPILAMIAPLAFVAYLLPNTEQWFKKWFDLLIKMLMMYPLAALIFSGARFAGAIIMGEGGTFNVIIGLMVMTMPLFSLPFLAKQGGAILNAVNGGLNKLVDRARKPISDTANDFKEHAAAKYLNQNAEYNDKGNRRNRISRTMRRASQALSANRQKRQWENSQNNDEFQDKIMNNQIDGREGRSLKNPHGNQVDYRAAYDSSRAASQALKLNDKESDSRIISQNPVINGQRLQDRAFVANQNLEKANSLNDARIANNRSFDDLRLNVDHAKSNAEAATARASTRTEKDPSTTIVRADKAAAIGELENAQEHTKTIIAELGTQDRDGVTISGAAATVAAAAPGVRTQLQDNVIQQTVNSNATAQAVSYQKQDVADALTATGSDKPGGVARQAAGMAGDVGVARVQATAVAAQAQFRKDNVNANKSLFANERYTQNASGELMNVVTAGALKGSSAPATPEQRQAAMEMLIETGSPESMATLYNHIASLKNGDPETVAMRQAYKAAVLSSGKKPASIGGGTIGQLAAGEVPTDSTGMPLTFADLALATLNDGKLSPEGLAAIDAKELAIMANACAANSGKITNADNLKKTITAAYTDRSNYNKFKPEQTAEIEKIAALVGLSSLPIPTP